LGFVVFVAVFAISVMARTYAAEFRLRQQGTARKIGLDTVVSGMAVAP
jgi:hypothetical protein